jgi:inositol hexakisphosphate/diphosphoinositol-pentakisphosphate kinase
MYKMDCITRGRGKRLMLSCFSFITRLTEEEKTWADKICEGFGQRVCGFDMLRCDNGRLSHVIDVNGWSFVKGNDTYYGIHPLTSLQYPLVNNFTLLSDKAADILAALCMRLSSSIERPQPAADAPAQESFTWLLKANVTVFRHADRTPKVNYFIFQFRIRMSSYLFPAKTQV